MNEELAKKLCLKVVYGGHLSAEEKRVWEAYRQTEAGQDFLKGCSEMKHFLDDMATIELTPTPPTDLKVRFETLIKTQIERSRYGWRGWAFWLLPTTTIVAALMTGWSYWTSGWFAQLPLFLFGIICGGLASLVGIYCRKMISAQTDLTEYLKDQHHRANTLTSRVATILVFLTVPLAGGFVEYYRIGWERGVLAFVTMLVMSGFFLILHWIRRRELRQADPDLWQWWDEELNNVHQSKKGTESKGTPSRSIK